MRIHARQLLTPEGMQPDRMIIIEKGCIEAVLPHDGNADFSCEYLTPGLIDLHCHGGAGFNARDFELDGIAPFLNQMLSAGVTDFLMTISTGRRELMRHGLEVTRQAMQLQREGKLGGARILGAHLEGPFLSARSAGAMQTSAMRKPERAAYDELFEGYEDIIRMVTLAPEEEGADELIAHLHDKGVCVQAGHTYATYDEAMRGFSLGADSLCHSFNGCRGIHHREPGVVTAALEGEHIYMEAICDLVHLHPAILRLIYRMKGPERMCAISDSVLTHGLPDGEYHVEGYDIIVKDGVSRTAAGALDGGGVYLDGAVRNLISIGIPAADAFTMSSTTPAARIGLESIGSIAAGKAAHLTAWDADCKPVRTWTEGDVQWKS